LISQIESNLFKSSGLISDRGSSKPQSLILALVVRFFRTVNSLSPPGGVPMLSLDSPEVPRRPPKVSLPDELLVMVWLRLMILSGDGLATSDS
jgi:hypothetical protein